MKNVKNRIVRGKRGIVDVQFNWIFILIAGFVIFLFIISIIFSQKRNADNQTNAMAVNQVTTLLKSKQQTADVYSEINLPDADITFRCDADTEYFSYKLSGAERVTLPTEIIFAPQSLSSNKIQIWTKAFDAGFPVGVFSYITTQNTILIIYNNSVCPYVEQVYAALPANVTKKITNDTAKYSSYKNMKIVCFNNLNNPSGCGCPKNSLNLDYINVTPITTTNPFTYGNVTFHRKGSTDVKKPYIGSVGLFGAVFSDTPEYYDCQMSRALKHFEVKRSLVAKRLEMMQKDLGPQSCSTKLSVVLDDTIIPLSNISFNSANMTRMYRLAEDLDEWNTELILSSCPKIY